MKRFLSSTKIYQRAFIIITAIIFFSIPIVVSNLTSIRDIRPQAATGSQTRSPAGSGTSNTCTSSSVAWTDTGKIQNNDQIYATATTTGAVFTNCLHADNFDFSIPSGANIDNIVIKIDRKAGHDDASRSFRDERVEIRETNKFNSGQICPGNCFNERIPTSDSQRIITYSHPNLTPAIINSFSFELIYQGFVEQSTAYIDHIQITVNYTLPSSSPPPPDPDPPSNGGGSTPTTPVPGNGSSTLPPPPIGIPGVDAPIDPDIVNTLKINISIPYLLGNIKSSLNVGGFVQELEIKSGLKDYEVDVRGAKFPLGKDLNVQIGGNKVLIKKLKIKTKVPKQPVKFGALYLGDTNRDNKINDEDLLRHLESIQSQDESADVNVDGVVNSFDWAILLSNFGRIGDR